MSRAAASARRSTCATSIASGIVKTGPRTRPVARIARSTSGLTQIRIALWRSSLCAAEGVVLAPVLDVLDQVDDRLEYAGRWSSGIMRRQSVPDRNTTSKSSLLIRGSTHVLAPRSRGSSASHTDSGLKRTYAAWRGEERTWLK